MSVLAGFTAAGGDFWLPRATIDPPAILLQMVLSEPEDRQAWYLSLLSGRLSLEELRLVFLQDAVFMKQKSPNHLMWEHEIFVTLE